MQPSVNSRNQITIQLDSESVKAYNSASPDQKKKIQLLLNACLKEVTEKDKTSLKKVMDQISENAQSKGLTPEILETILSE